MFITASADVTMSNVVFDSSEATYGGSLYVSSANVTLNNVTSNDSRAKYSGGFVYGSGAQLTFNNVTLIDPTGEKAHGAGLFATAFSTVVWTDGAVSGAISDDFLSGYTGGAIHVRQSSTLEITGVRFEENTAYNGGAIDIQDGSSATVTDCSFEDNLSYRSGGAIRIYDSSNADFSNNDFIGNEANRGGAVEVSVDADLVDNNSVYRDNYANDTVGGALRLSEQSTYHGYGGRFENNDSVQSGGAVHLYDAAETVLIESCAFEGNESMTGDGGAISSNNEVPLTVSYCTFTENSASAGAGGALAFEPARPGYSLTVNDSVVEDNYAGDEGGGFSVSDADEMFMYETDFFINRSNNVGGALYLDDCDVVILKRALFHGNTASRGGELFTNAAQISLLKSQTIDLPKMMLTMVVLI